MSLIWNSSSLIPVAVIPLRAIPFLYNIHVLLLIATVTNDSVPVSYHQIY